MRVLTVLGVSLLFSLSSFAMTLDDLSPGTTVHGPSLTMEQMKGKVVYVEYWGTRCPPCRRLMPQLAALYKKYESQGFHLIGLECQGSATETILGLAKESQVTYQVTTGGDLKGSHVTFIPHGFLFDTEGNMVADNPRGPALEEKVKELLLSDTSPQLQLEHALALKEKDPVAALAKLNKIATQFSADEAGAKARQELDAMKKDPVMQKELGAVTMFTQVSALQDSLQPYQGAKNLRDENFRKLNAATIQSIISSCQMIALRYPGTVTAKNADAMINMYR